MRRTSLVCLCAVGLLLLGSLKSHAQDDATKKEIETQYTLISQEVIKGSVADTGKVADADFKHITMLGKEGKVDQWAAEIKKTTALYKAPESKLTLKEVTLKGDTATAVFNTKFSGEGTLADGRMGALDFQIVERTSWSKASGAWKLKVVRHVWQETRLDKKLVPFVPAMEDKESVKGIQGLYGLLSDIYTKQDWDALEKMLPEDLPVSDINGQPLTKFELMERLRAGARLLVDPIVFFSILQVGHEGESLKVARLATVIANVKLPGGKTGRLQYINVTRDTFVKGEKDKGWVTKKSEEIHADALLDGMPIPLALISGR